MQGGDAGYRCRVEMQGRDAGPGTGSGGAGGLVVHWWMPRTTCGSPGQESQPAFET